MAATENNQGWSDGLYNDGQSPAQQPLLVDHDHLGGLYSDAEHHEVTCATIGKIHVYIQGQRSSHEVVILTVHDLGCNYNMYDDFVLHPKMTPIRDRTVWVHVTLPGQQPDAPDLPAGYIFPTMQKVAEEMIAVLDQLKIKEVVCFGEGAGANILARFTMAHPDRIMGCVLLHCTGTTAGFMESLKDKVISWKLDHIGMNPTAEAYLILHRYGAFHTAEDQEQLRNAIDNYQSNLRTRANAKNLKGFVEAFLRRTNIADKVDKLKCPLLLVTGQKSVFNATTKSLYQAIIKVCSDKDKVEMIEVQGVANILEERPERLVESFQYFLQGLGLVSSVPMHHISRPMRVRSMSMEEYDQPKLRCRSMSGGGEQLANQSPAKVVPAAVTATTATTTTTTTTTTTPASN